MRMDSGFREAGRSFRGAGASKRRRAVNLTVDETVLTRAKALKINLSLTLERELKKQIRERETTDFRNRHAQAVASHNRFIEENGIWSEKYRSW
jgi:antitoxin CcdA